MSAELIELGTGQIAEIMAACAGGSGVTVWAVIKITLKNMSKEIHEAKSSSIRAHIRIDGLMNRYISKGH